MSSHPGSSHSISYAANAQASDISNPQGSTAPYQALPPGVHHSGHGFHGHGDDAASFHHHPSFLGAVVASGDPQYHAAAAAAAAATTLSHDSVFDIAVNQQPLDLEVVVPRYPLQGTDYIHAQSDSGGGFHPQTLTGVGQLPPHAGSQELPMRYQQAAAAADPPVSSSAEESNDGQRPKRVGAPKPRDAGPEPGSKKRSLDEAGGADEAAEGKKRARGRPRLNPKDQTATEVCHRFFSCSSHYQSLRAKDHVSMPALKPLRYAVAHVSPDYHPYSPAPLPPQTRIPEEEPV